MSAGSVQRTAQIIRFPAGGRRASTDSGRQVPAAELETQAAAVAAADAWYHDAAVQDAKRSGER